MTLRIVLSWKVLKRILTLLTNRIYSLPILVLMPHSRCNCRCVMCDIWKANHDKRELSVEEISKHVYTLRKLRVREIVMSGGEALMHSNFWNFCNALKSKGRKLTLLSTGLLLDKHSEQVVKNLDEVIISVDGSPEVHNKVRNVPDGFAKIVSGIRNIKNIKKDFRITARCVLQRYNYADFVNIVESAKEAGFDQVSFLAADVSSTAFNRPTLWDDARVREVALSVDETIAFEKILNESFKELSHYYRSKFIAESPAKMMRIVRHYRSINGQIEFNAPVCNAPWVSAVIESDGSVLPCFFHKPYGNIHNDSLLSILNSPSARQFRKNLDVATDDVCRKCVCSLKLGVSELN